MPAKLETKPDSTRDTALENDRPRAADPERPARTGDSMTLTLGGDRIKVTLLGFVDPAVIDNPGIDALFDRLAGDAGIDQILMSAGEAREVRYAAVHVKTRNLDPPVEGRGHIVHVGSAPDAFPLRAGAVAAADMAHEVLERACVRSATPIRGGLGMLAQIQDVQFRAQLHAFGLTQHEHDEVLAQIEIALPVGLPGTRWKPAVEGTHLRAALAADPFGGRNRRVQFRGAPGRQR